MFLNTIHGIIERRVLLNYRIEPEALRRVLPAPFRPKLFKGQGIGGICMIRFKQLRPRYAPAFLGLDSDNAAHRFAVEWDQDGQLREGVFIPRRDTNSWLNQTLGGRLFPGIQRRRRFETQVLESAVSMHVTGEDGGTEVSFAGHAASQLPPDSIFPSIDAASEFFLRGSTGYSATRAAGHYQGMELHSLNWKVTPLAIDRAQSAFFDDEDRFPAGSIQLDCALLMRDIQHEWRSRPDLHLNPSATQLTAYTPGGAG